MMARKLAITVFTVTAFVFGLQAKEAFAAGQEIVQFRLTNWKTAHFNDAKKAQSHSATLKQIGCEVKQHAHGSHHDVSYRCPKWRSISLKSHNQAHQWEGWLKSKGFETAHNH
jgi:hypothetical protein